MISRLRHYVRVAVNVILRKRLWDFYTKYIYHEPRDDQFQRRFSYRRQEPFLETFKQHSNKRFFFSSQNRKEFFLSLVTSIQPLEDICEQADDTCDNKFQTLGSAKVSLGQEINWHRDFKSGKEWQPLHAASINYYLDMGNPSDLKVPWELSRFHQTLWLGKAYWITSSDQYAKCFQRLIETWVQQNPVGYGMNWSIAMEVAIRACNWIMGWYYFSHCPSLSSEFWMRFLKMLFLHGVYIENNLEYTRKPGNHYLSNVVGLVFLGFFFRDTRAGQRWLRKGVQYMKEELPRQVTSDGVDYEKSTSYQRLVLELFTAATILCQRNNIRLSESYMQRLERMFEYVQHYTRPDGSIPLVGDADDGRLFRFSMNDDINDHRHMLSVGAVLFNRSDFKASAGKFSQDALWYFGGEGFEKYQLQKEAPKPLTSHAFPQGGFYIMRSENAHVFIDAGDIGMDGRGGHGHNDTFSFELWAEGKPFIVDSGTYAYTFDVEARQAFRSTRAHNMVMVDDQEIAEFAGLWTITEDLTNPNILQWKTSGEFDILEAEHYGYTRLPQPVTHRRKFEFDKRKTSLVISDTLTGSGTHALQAGLHLHPDAVVEQKDGKRLTLTSGTIRMTVELSEFAQVVDSYYSPSYGVRIPNKTIQVRVSAQLPATIRTMISRG